MMFLTLVASGIIIPYTSTPDVYVANCSNKLVGNDIHTSTVEQNCFYYPQDHSGQSLQSQFVKLTKVKRRRRNLDFLRCFH
jgi:hypothetical protein